ncbi:DUF58 domain-containing protein [Rikenella microfusus]|uniref:Uncharacterized conserved protein (Some members contain a von Willebrand factor type A (VWA) domain) n=1 Tax=Rikenella microfusus TaxID=28139 RepID=A0A379MSD7_9BACT|nr:DUF58 domain-containing protein [Rikenella microfusus]SUE33810.1 Uncharacterized conserved protein (some members contain a von Willebrand factor type A (vWA) domain) [Rikenella microfusus]
MKENEEDILRKVRKIEIKTRGLSNDIFAGKYHSAFKGRGMAFSEVRDYRIGDDIRDIDWNVTARNRKPYIKVYEEERELTMMLLVDVSASRMFGTQGQLKKNLITEIAAVLAFSAAQNNDKIGCIFFSDRIEKYIPPKKGRQHVLRIISDLVDFQPEGRGTDLNGALRFFTNVMKKRCTAFLLTDFMDLVPGADGTRFEEGLKIASSRHDLVGLRIYDVRETALPDVGIVEMQDAETGRKVWVDTASRRTRDSYAAYWELASAAIARTLTKCRVDTVSVATGEDYVAALLRLFKMR